MGKLTVTEVDGKVDLSGIEFSVDGESFTAEQLIGAFQNVRKQLAQARKQAFLDAIVAVDSERLEEPQNEEDFAYDAAIDHAIEALRLEAEKCK